jgi:hypothetical protein
MTVIRDVAGQRFGQLTAIRDAGRLRKEVAWLCHCDCGGSSIVPGYKLRSGATQSCGCRKGSWRHGYGKPLTRHPIYRAWLHMRDRCTNPNHRQWKDYGGRGIAVCERWSNFTNFLADVGERPTPKHSLDRINNNGNYEPENVRWATKVQQNNNTRRNRRIAHGELRELPL